MSVHKNGGAGQPGRDVPMGVKVLALMGRKGVSQAAIARELGFNSWDELKAERVTL